MKKSIINLLLCAAALILGISCSKNAETGKIGPQLEDCSVSADVLGADTKVALDGTTPKWATNDKILVLDANKKPLGGTGLFTITSGSGTNEGNFSGKKYIGQTPAYAIYPASVYDATTGKFTLPTEQDGTKTTTFKDYAVMMGTVSSGNITFANVCAVLKINTGDYGKTDGEAAIKSLKVSAATSAIAGEFTPDWTNNTIAPVADDASMDVTASAASSYANGADVYLAIIPTASQALTFEFTNTNDEVATVTDTFAPATNTIKGLGTAGGMEFKTPGPDPNYWVDLGAVTKDGHKLLFARYNVASIDANGNAIFADTPEAPGGTFTAEQAATIKKAGGQECRVPTRSEFSTICYDWNTTYSYSNDVATFVGKLEGHTDKSLSFCANPSGALGSYHAYIVTGSYNFLILNQGSGGGPTIGGNDGAAHIRLVTALEETVEFSNVDLYSKRSSYDFINTSDFTLVTPTYYFPFMYNDGYFYPISLFENGFRFVGKEGDAYEILINDKHYSIGTLTLLDWGDNNVDIKDKSTGEKVKSYVVHCEL